MARLMTKNRSQMPVRKPAHSAGDHMTAHARELRKNATEEERWLWYRLRQLRKRGFNFRRQSPFGRYVLDFVCHKNRVVVELDGSQHGLPEHQKRDAERDRHLLTNGYRTFRIPNWWVKDDPDWVGEYICGQVSAPSARTAEDKDHEQ